MSSCQWKPPAYNWEYNKSIIFSWCGNKKTTWNKGRKKELWWRFNIVLSSFKASQIMMMTSLRLKEHPDIWWEQIKNQFSIEETEQTLLQTIIGRKLLIFCRKVLEKVPNMLLSKSSYESHIFSFLLLLAPSSQFPLQSQFYHP